MFKIGLIVFILFGSLFSKAPIVVIDPAGSSKDLGRVLLEGYERAETLKFARVLKDKLSKKYKVYPVVSRSASEEILSLQIPSFSNRLGASFFLRINMYREESVKPKIFFYHLMFDPLIDLAKRNFGVLSFIPLYQSHFINIGRTILLGTKMYEHLNQDFYKKYFECYELKGIPIKPLVGVFAPAVLLEIGICQENKWKSLVDPIVDSLTFLKELSRC